MIYTVTGTDKAGAKRLMEKALPILRRAGAPTDANTCVISEAIVVDALGEGLSIDNITFGFPAFDKLREGNLQSIANELARELGHPCYTIGAPIFAGFPK